LFSALRFQTPEELVELDRDLRALKTPICSGVIFGTSGPAINSTARRRRTSARMGSLLRNSSHSAQVSRANFFRLRRGLSGGRTPSAWSSFFIFALSAFSRCVRRFFFVGIPFPP
jgi:hypothetical protein